MSNTPRTDARVKQMIDNDQGPEGLEYWARDLERELDAANAEVDRLTAKVAQLYEGAKEQNQRIKRLEDAGNRLKDRYILENENWDLQTVNDWNDAKEAKL